MNALVLATLGVLGGLGLFVAALGMRGIAPAPRTDQAGGPRRPGLDRDAVVAVLVAFVAFAVTRWIAAGGLAAAAAWMAPRALGAKGRRAEVMARTEAVATWSEQLRDTMRAAAAGLHEAIATTALVAPMAIRPHVAELATRLRREPFRVAMAKFAHDVDDPTADKIATALVLASERRASNLADLLGEVAATARQQAAMQLRVEASRGRLYTQSGVVCAITATVVAALVLLNRTYLEPYDSAAGQTVLVLIGALFAASGAGLVKLGEVNRGRRILRLSTERPS